MRKCFSSEHVQCNFLNFSSLKSEPKKNLANIWLERTLSLESKHSMVSCCCWFKRSVINQPEARTFQESTKNSLVKYLHWRWPLPVIYEGDFFFGLGAEHSDHKWSLRHDLKIQGSNTIPQRNFFPLNDFKAHELEYKLQFSTIFHSHWLSARRQFKRIILNVAIFRPNCLVFISMI